MKNDGLKAKETDGLSRRTVLKSAVALASITMGGSLALNLAQPGTAEAMTKKMPTKWDETWDVAVVGSGFAGLAAAAEAAEGGAKVVIFEKMRTYGGNSIIDGGEFNAWDDKFHLREKLNLGDDSVDQFVKDTLKGGDYYNFPELVEVLAKESTSALNWMIDEGGAKIREVVSRAGGHTAYRSRTAAEGSGRGFTEPLRKLGEHRGVKMRLNTALTWIWRKDADPKSPIEGIEVKSGKNILNIKILKGLVIATGGFSRDKAMLKAFNPSISDQFNCTNHLGATGESIRMAQAVGADAVQLAFVQLTPIASGDRGMVDKPALYPYRGPGLGLIYVSKKGKRFVNELERRDVVCMAQVNTGDKPTYAIFNEAMIPKMGTKEEVMEGVSKGRFVEANSISELAAKLNIPSAALVETVNKHNQFIASGRDEDFNKVITKVMLPLDKGPFYGIDMWPAVHHTMGGLRINTNAQVVDIWGNTIPRLFAAGEVTGGIHGSNRLGGNAITDCVVFGRIAGKNAAKV